MVDKATASATEDGGVFSWLQSELSMVKIVSRAVFQDGAADA